MDTMILMLKRILNKLFKDDLVNQAVVDKGVTKLVSIKYI
jgi:hypothetical protein